MVQKLADGDSPALAAPSWQPALDAVIEGEAAFAHEL